MSKLILNKLCVYPWTQSKGVSFRGYFIINDILYKGKLAITYLLEKLDDIEFEDILLNLNGIFSIIIEKSDGIYFATDRLRALPLFYAFIDGDLIISDSANSIYDMLPTLNFNNISMEEFSNSGLFVSGQNTIFNEIKQVQASECIYYSQKKDFLECKTYFEYIHGNFITDEEKLKKEFNNTYKEVGRNLVKALAGRTAVIPLSGGADSRMVATLLKNEGYDKVICFSYGRVNNTESQISKEVADSLGYKWLMVPYTRRLWRELSSSKLYNQYLRYAGNFISLPHIQDFLAVKRLKDTNAIPEDSVFVPGHSGDLIAGSHITYEFLKESMTGEEFIMTIYRKFYKLRTLSPEVKGKILSNFKNSLETTVESLASYSEWFNIRERQAKFIVNSVRVYEFFGYEWLIPLWDNELFKFWREVPISWRYNRKLYFTCVPSNSLRSTNDLSIIKHIADTIRKIPLTRIIVRKLSKFYKYYFSPLQVEGICSFCSYFKECISADEYFTINDLIKKQYLGLLKEKTNDLIKKV